MKKFIAILAASLIIMTAFAACQNDNATTSSTSANQTVSTTEKQAASTADLTDDSTTQAAAGTQTATGDSSKADSTTSATPTASTEKSESSTADAAKTTVVPTSVTTTK